MVIDYKQYVLDSCKECLSLMIALKLTEDELLNLKISEDGFDIEVLTDLIIKRYRKHTDTCYRFEELTLYIECPNEDNNFKSEMLKFKAHFPKYDIKFIKHGHFSE